MTAAFPQYTCRICGADCEIGEILPFRHTHGRPTNVRPHYAMASRASQRAQEVGLSPRPPEALPGRITVPEGDDR
jgi:hypothetical protein